MGYVRKEYGGHLWVWLLSPFESPSEDGDSRLLRLKHSGFPEVRLGTGWNWL